MLKTTSLIALLLICLACSALFVESSSHALYKNGRIVYRRSTYKILRGVIDEIMHELSDSSALTTDVPTPEYPCPTPTLRQDKSIDEFIQLLNGASLDKQLAEFEKFLLTPSLPFTFKQALKIIPVFANNQFAKKHVTKSLLKRLVDMKAGEAIGMIQSVTDLDWERFKLLELAATYITDLFTNREYLLMALFNDPIIKEKASLMLNQIKPHDCAFGGFSSLGVDRVLFVIERSDSMSTSKISSSSKRIDFVKYHLNQILKRLSPETLFNIVSFNENVYKKFDTFVPATPANIEQTAQSVYGSAGYYSSSVNAQQSMKTILQLFTPALSQNGNNLVYVLSCSPGNRGEYNNAEKLAEFVREYAEMGRATVNTIAFTLGEEYYSVTNRETYREQTSKNWNAIAYATGGSFRRV